jgi:RNA polymerase sigma factor (sigma-70 family)
MSAEPSDFELLEQWGAGNQMAGQTLFARHFDVLYAFLRRRAIDSVEDLAQEAFLACVENRARFRREASFRTYLLQIARYRLYAHYQRLSRLAEGDADGCAATRDSSPTCKLGRKQDERLVLFALRRLPPAFQVVLKLSFFDELSGPQIAELLQIPEATVRNRVWRALKRLKEETQRLANDAGGLRDTASELRTWAERLHAAGGALPSS